MCGIVGYIGRRMARPVLLSALQQLEYRGYDSAGVATVEPSGISIKKQTGRVGALLAAVASEPTHATCGISHTRWATHGGVTDKNAHPHSNEAHTIAIVHNGVIENYHELREKLRMNGTVFRSETDSEVIAHLLGQELSAAASLPELVSAVRRALMPLKGTYGLAIISSSYPDTLIGVRLGSPLLIGIGKGEHFLASDASALIPYTNQVAYMNDGDIAVLRPHEFSLYRDGRFLPQLDIKTLEGEVGEISKGDFEHYMRKEIYEQPRTVENAYRGRIDLTEATARFGGLNLSLDTLRAAKRIILTACGTSWHAALFGEYILEELARIPVEVEYASELRYRNAPIEEHTLCFCLSQSGETADTLAALQEIKRQGVPTLGIVNVVGSSIARTATGGIYLHAGPEIGVASTKAFTAQLTVLVLLAIYLGRLRHLTPPRARTLLSNLQTVPRLLEKTLRLEGQIQRIANTYKEAHTILYLGRGYHFPVALEGALKLKEVSYIHAEGYPAAEMKHGPIALVDASTPTIIINPRGVLYDKVMSNLEEIKARGGPVIAIATEGDSVMADKADEVLTIPTVDECLQPLLSVIPLQLLAYHMALLKGCDVDKPRNLAKSVTVE